MGKMEWDDFYLDQLNRDINLSAISFSPHIARYAPLTADPAAVERHLAEFRSRHQQRSDLQEVMDAILTDEAWCRRLVLAFGNSSYLAHLILRWPEFLLELHQNNFLAPPEEELQRLLREVLSTEKREEAARYLRLFKHRHYLAIGLRDLTCEAPLEETTQALSRVADFTLEASYRWLDRWLSQRHGQPMNETTTPPQPSRFVILGMGKLGGRELNFSSDIDLIFLYDEDRGHTHGEKPLPIKSYYIRLGQELMKLMQENTPEGMVFRVDLRLRPDGESGDLSLSCRSAEIYYEAYGQTWERAAMIKARPVAGDLAMGEEFLQRLRPFIFRRYLDFASLDAIRRMKRKIDHKILQNSTGGHNVKLGRGGIREIEFFVQAQQLIHGGREPSLRQRSTLPMLQELKRLGLVDGQTADTLAEAYPFLRMVEHRLQIYREQQLHTLPTDEGELLCVAKRAGFADLASFLDRLQQITQQVHHIYGNLFFESERRSQPEEEMEALLALDIHSSQWHQQVREMGFQEPEALRSLLILLREGPSGANLTESARKWYDMLAAPLLAEIHRAADQDLALHHAEAFLRAIGRRTNYLALLVENSAVLGLLVRLFGISRFLSRFFNQTPSLLDSLIAPGFLDHYRDKSELGKELAKSMSECPDAEERGRVIRAFKNTELLRIGLRDISGIADLSEVMAGLSVLADAILTQTMIDALTEMEDRYGIPTWQDEEGNEHRAQFVILAMGKLGGSELNYASDLDL
ncbi:MAG: bifunctional [glutamate--ammonia ligase]-adenylyl-L-tyrosine phosphorylase/[glutamate--ammonia-ligase] adenylyltransferase, partial [Magnetococcales bacterium]|nr:bifunctional [glutamate--ammonia ligase]-adenylyl-L-tyrosine phosphorylase/[glutamate--ammonia-ligase] adenylyltransferase [Magnetococcales bacterium]